MNLRIADNRKEEEAMKKIVEYCRKRPEMLYKTEHFIEVLGIDVDPMEFGVHLALKHKGWHKFGLLKVIFLEELENYYGFSEVCGSRECYESWCAKDTVSCPTGKGNEKLRFHRNLKLNP